VKGVCPSSWASGANQRPSRAATVWPRTPPEREDLMNGRSASHEKYDPPRDARRAQCPDGQEGGQMRAHHEVSRRHVLGMAVGAGSLAMSGGVGALVGCAATTSPARAASSDPTNAQITILYDAFGKVPVMQKDWGYGALIEYGGRRILFDTGNNPDVLAQNARAKGVDLSRLDFVVMSHRHGDHMGGMAYLLSVNPKVKIYAPKEGFGVYGADLPSTFYRKDASLPPEQRYYDGAPPQVMRFGSAWAGANFELIDRTTEIAPRIHLIALVSDKPGTLELRGAVARHQHARRDGAGGGLLASRHREDRGERDHDPPAYPLHRRRVPPGRFQGPGDREGRGDPARLVQGSLRCARPLHG
jgi:hypothetical protein